MFAACINSAPQLPTSSPWSLTRVIGESRIKLQCSKNLLDFNLRYYYYANESLWLCMYACMFVSQLHERADDIEIKFGTEVIVQDNM